VKQIIRILCYLVFILLVGIMYHYGFKFTYKQQELNIHLFSLLIAVHPMFIGVLLGLIGFHRKPKTDNFEYDWVMALGLGIPLVYLTFQPSLAWNYLYLPALPYFFDFPISGIVLGYVLVASVKGIPFSIGTTNQNH